MPRIKKFAIFCCVAVAAVIGIFMYGAALLVGKGEAYEAFCKKHSTKQF